MKATSTLAVRRVMLCGIALFGMTFGFAAVQPAVAQATGASGSATASMATGGGAPFGHTTTLPYAREYPAIPYTQMPIDNAIARLQGRIDRGEVKLVYRPPRGVLESIRAALGIDPSSQTLVYSKTSLQTGEISA